MLFRSLNDKWRMHPTAQARFEREITALASMSHPNIVTCEGVSLPGNARFYLMPLYSTSVRRHIASNGYRGDWRAVARCGTVLAEALQYAHSQWFIHRDVKPDNILFNPGGPLVIADWGIGYFVHQESQVLQQLTRGGMGTEYYCSREQWTTGKCDARGDIYALGMTLDEWVSGRQRVITVGAGVSGAPNTATVGGRRLGEVIARMTRQAAGDRYAAMSVVAAELRAIAKL